MHFCITFIYEDIILVLSRKYIKKFSRKGDLSKMLELINQDQDVLNTKARITIDLIKDGQEFLMNFNINHEFLNKSVSIVYRYLRTCGKIPHNTYKFFIAAYYIVSRHYSAFPVHESKKKFCNKFGIQESSLDYCVERINGVLGYKRILDDNSHPYYFNPKHDIGYNHLKSVTKERVRHALMSFYLEDRPINPRILSEELVDDIIRKSQCFPDELFRQFYSLILEIIEERLNKSDTYIKLQKRIFIHF